MTHGNGLDIGYSVKKTDNNEKKREDEVSTTKYKKLITLQINKCYDLVVYNDIWQKVMTFAIY